MTQEKGLADWMSPPREWLSMQVTLHSYNNEQSRKIIEDELKRQIPDGFKYWSTEWHTYLTEDYATCYIVFEEVHNAE
jgi:hypothetical protein